MMKLLRLCGENHRLNLLNRPTTGRFHALSRGLQESQVAVLRRQIADAGYELRNSWAYKVAMRSRVAPRKAVSLDVAQNFFDGLGVPQWEHFLPARGHCHLHGRVQRRGARHADRSTLGFRTKSFGLRRGRPGHLGRALQVWHAKRCLWGARRIYWNEVSSYAPISRRGEIAVSVGAASSLRAVNEECCIGALQAKDSLPDSLNAKSRVDDLTTV